MLFLADVIEALTGYHPHWAEIVISEAVVDSRAAIPGSLFIALPGERAHGHEFVQAAFERGAHLALVEKTLDLSHPVIDLTNDVAVRSLASIELPAVLLVDDSLKALQQVARFWRRKHQLRVIGITGSVGKSTTKELVAEILNQRYHTIKNPGNLNNEIGLPLTLLKLSKWYERAVLEMGFYVPGEIALLCDLSLPEVGVVTNIGTVHAERAGTQAEIVRGKTELVQSLPAAPEGVAVLNYDDALVRTMSQKTQAKIFYYGLDPQAHLWADNIESLGLEGVRFRLHYQDEVLQLRVPLIGRHSVHTALRATAVGLVEGLTWQEIVSGLRSGYTQLHLVAVRTQSGAILLDDTYNASPESTLAALNLLDDLDGRKVAVLGDMLELGIYEEQGHQTVGIRAAQVADELVTVGTRGKWIANAARHAGISHEKVTEVENNEGAIDYLSNRLKEGDVVLVKGSRGMRMDLIINELEAV